MKVNIITIHDPDVNYGSTLQACGTYNYIKNLGYDVKIIDYRPNYKTTKQRIKKKVVGIVFYKYNRSRRKKIDSYLKNNAELTKRYKTYDALTRETPEADVYITGSDVIWNRDDNPEGKDLAFYLNFVKKGYKVSYAPSMGDIQPEENLQFIKKCIKDYKFISVREEQSMKQLHEVGLDDAKCVTDPVFLLDRDYYLNKTSENKYGKYTLVYLISETEEKRKKINTITAAYGDKVISFGGFKQKCDCDLFIRDAGVEDFLTLISHAQHIICDSFHCVAFSLMFEKQFLYLPSIRTSMRIENLLDYVDLEHRLVKEVSKDIIDDTIDYSVVTKALDKKVEFSRDYLKNALKSCEESIEK